MSTSDDRRHTCSPCLRGLHTAQELAAGGTVGGCATPSICRHAGPACGVTPDPETAVGVTLAPAPVDPTADPLAADAPWRSGPTRPARVVGFLDAIGGSFDGGVPELAAEMGEPPSPLSATVSVMVSEGKLMRSVPAGQVKATRLWLPSPAERAAFERGQPAVPAARVAPAAGGSATAGTSASPAPDVHDGHTVDLGPVTSGAEVQESAPRDGGTGEATGGDDAAGTNASPPPDSPVALFDPSPPCDTLPAPEAVTWGSLAAAQRQGAALPAPDASERPHDEHSGATGESGGMFDALAAVAQARAAERDSVYSHLHAAREHLCLAQTALPAGDEYRKVLGKAVARVDVVGHKACPEQWSRFDRVDLLAEVADALAADVVHARPAPAAPPAAPSAGAASVRFQAVDGTLSCTISVDLAAGNGTATLTIDTPWPLPDSADRALVSGLIDSVGQHLAARARQRPKGAPDGQ